MASLGWNGDWYRSAEARWHLITRPSLQAKGKVNLSNRMKLSGIYCMSVRFIYCMGVRSLLGHHLLFSLFFQYKRCIKNVCLSSEKNETCYYFIHKTQSIWFYTLIPSNLPPTYPYQKQYYKGQETPLTHPYTICHTITKQNSLKISCLLIVWHLKLCLSNMSVNIKWR